MSSLTLTRTQNDDPVITFGLDSGEMQSMKVDIVAGEAYVTVANWDLLAQSDIRLADFLALLHCDVCLSSQTFNPFQLQVQLRAKRDVADCNLRLRISDNQSPQSVVANYAGAVELWRSTLPPFDEGDREVARRWYRSYKNRECVGQFGEFGFTFLEKETYLFQIEYKLASVTASVSDILADCRALMDGVIDGLMFATSAAVAPDAVRATFSFPTQTRAACEQYLSYFCQFLSDLGIEATAEMRDEAGKVLFSVFPKDGRTALQKIQEALEIYLNLPSAVDVYAPMYAQGNIAFDQLISNVQHLQSQLLLARATIGMQETALRLQRHEIAVLQTADVAAPSQGISNPEVILDGLVTIREYELKGVSINLPELFRRLRRQFLK